MPFQRYDHEVIASWIAPGEKVLDLGCGDGTLLKELAQTRQVLGYGVENDGEYLKACLANGFFDHVIMSMSLQAVHNTQGILAEMLRVGREAVVSFPNFAYWRHRQSLLNGHMPVSSSLPHQWYNTPNRRFFTISDFEALCEMNGIVIREGLGFDEGVVIKEEPNFLASLALYRLGRDH